MDGQNLIVLASALGIGLGILLKAIPNSKINTKIIPIVITVGMFLKNVAISAGLLPPEASVLSMAEISLPSWLMMPDGDVGLAFVWGKWLTIIAQLAFQTVFDSAIPIGLHSGVKNTIEYKKGRAKAAAPTRSIKRAKRR